jgi:hypothetical protein
MRMKYPAASTTQAPAAPGSLPEPEVMAAKAALDALPSEWVREDFAATILRRANLQAATRKLGADIAAAEGAVAVAVGALDATDETIAALVGAKAALSRLEAARAIVPPAIADPVLVAQALASAALTLQRSAPAAPAPLDYLDQIEQWRNWSRIARVPVDAPVATDADRAAEVAFTAATARVSTWRAGHAAWTQAKGIGDVIDMLNAAASYVAQAAEASAVVVTADEQTSAANTHRTAAGLTWSVPR